MTKPIKKIILFLILIIALPILFFLFKETSNLNETEEMIETIYKKQLNAVLFSVNQYSEDLTRNWVNKIEAYDFGGGLNSKSAREELKILLKENASIEYIFASNSDYDMVNIVGGNKVTAGETNIRKLLQEQDKTIKKLFSYQSDNYQKIEPLQHHEQELQYLVSVTKSKLIYGIAINKDKFVKKELTDKFSSISPNEFSFVVWDTTTNQTVIAIDFLKGEKLQSSRALWIIPDYKMGIGLKGQTIDQLVGARNKSNIFLLLGLLIIMLLAAWYGFNSIRKEIELAQIKNDFVSNVSHELRTPLALINMFAETLSLGRVKTEEKKIEYYGIIQQETERLSKIVNKILNFSKIEAGKWKYNFTEVDLNEIVNKVYDVYKFHLKNSGFEFSLSSSGIKLPIYADGESISEALINLIDNAVKYSTEEKKICIMTGLESSYCFVEVKDNGIGISQDDQKRIFEKFFRVSTKEVHNTKGTGLGLTLVKHIVEANKGEIRINSEEGKGSAFKINFPLLEARS